jgi:hypothetical protein
VSRLALPGALLDETFDLLARCGDRQRECVVYWLAALREPDLVARVVHPEHRSGPFGYEVESDYVNELFLALRQTGETVRAQVHTHPADAFHSGVDDDFALAPSRGFLSLVIPDFAHGPVGLVGSHLVEIYDDGRWIERHPEDAIVLL